MAIAHRKNQSKEFVLKADRGLQEDQQTRFKLRSLGERAKALLLDRSAKLGDSGEMIPQVGSTIHAAVKFGIAGWENLKDEAGTQVEPQFGLLDGCECLTEDSIGMVGPYLMELGAAVIEFNKLTETDRGNSVPLPASAKVGSSPTALEG